MSKSLEMSESNQNCLSIKIDKTTLVECIHNIQSLQSINQRNGLKQLQLIVQNVKANQNDPLIVIQILQQHGTSESTYIIVDQESSNRSSARTCSTTTKPLYILLLDIISNQNDNSTELCRERAALCLEECFKALMKRMQTNDNTKKSNLQEQQEQQQTQEKNTTIKEFMYNFYFDYSKILHERFGPMSKGSNSQNHRSNGAIDNVNYKGGIFLKPVEESEEIRLTLIKIMSNVLLLIEKLGRKEVNHQDSDINKKLEKEITSSTGLLCKVLSKSALLDLYPDLKRESCILVKHLCKTFPHTIRMNEASLLNAIIGPPMPSSTSYLQQGKEVISKASMELMKNCVVRHRHAKSRSLALEVITSIMYCHDDRNDSNDANDESNDTSSIKSISSASSNNNCCFNNMLEERLISHVVPNLESSLPHDHSASVRLTLAKTIGNLLKLALKNAWKKNFDNDDDYIINNDKEYFTIISRTASIPRLVTLLLMGMSDDANSVQIEASNQLHDNTDLWMSNLSCDKNDIKALNLEQSLPYFMAIIGYDVITYLLLNVSNISSIESKKMYLKTLCISIHLLKNDVDHCFFAQLWSDDLVTKIVMVLCNTLSDEDTSIFQSAIKCGKALGTITYTRSKVLMLVTQAFHMNVERSTSTSDEILTFDDTSNVCSKIIISSSQQYSSALSLMTGILRGWTSVCYNMKSLTNSDPAIEEIVMFSKCLTDERLLDSMHSSSDTALSLLGLCHALVSFISKIQEDTEIYIGTKTTEGGDSITYDITLCCVNLLGCYEHFNVRKSTLELLDNLSNLLPRAGSMTELLDMYFYKMFKSLKQELYDKTNEGTWEYGERNLNTFDALVRNCNGRTIGENFENILLVFEKHLAVNCTIDNQTKQQLESKFKTKLFFMALIESLVSSESLPKESIQPSIEKLVTVAIIPNLVWQVGGMASALRKLSAAVLFAILQGDCTTTMIIFSIAPQLLPVLKSNLSDDDSSMRELTISSMRKIFEILPGSLGVEAIHQIYPELMKCLDDSSANVRYAACDTLKQFLRCSVAKNFHGTAITYMVEHLFIHLDDPEPSFQEKIYDVLVAASDIDADEVIKNANSSLSSHSSRHYCNLLLQHSLERKVLAKVF